MPYTVKKDVGKCSANKPWAVLKTDTGALVPGGCHETKAKAMKHLAALESNVTDAVQAAKDSEFKTVVIEAIPIVETGIEYPLSTGPATFTEQDLADAVEAAQNNPAVKNPRLKLGWQNEGSNAKAGHGPGFISGEPSFGTFFNFRLSANKQQILADLETLDWLAELLPIAYPARSIEGRQMVELKETGRTYGLVIDAVALLGVEMPGVSTLDDLRDIFTNPEVEVVGMQHSNNPKRVVVRAQIDADEVRRSFYNDFAQGDRYFWWIRSIRLDPNEIIAEDEAEGQLHRVPFTINDRDVEFGDPVAVYVQYADEPEQQTAKAVLATWSTAASSRIQSQEVNVDPKELRKRLGLPEDATDEQVLARIDELGETSGSEGEPSATGGESNSDDANSDDANSGETQTQNEPEPATTAASASRDGDGVRLDAAAYEQLRQDAQAGREAREQQMKERRASKVEAAIKAGKIPPSRRKHYIQLMGKDEDGTTQFLDELEENVVPVVEAGSSADTGDDDSAFKGEGGGVGYPTAHLTPAERARIEAFYANNSQGV